MVYAQSLTNEDKVMIDNVFQSVVHVQYDYRDGEGNNIVLYGFEGKTVQFKNYDRVLVFRNIEETEEN